jgi:hypothetical protein
MFDLQFKNMKVIRDFMGNAHAIQIVTYYDTNIVCLVLLQLFLHLNHVRVTIDQPMVVEDGDLFST